MRLFLTICSLVALAYAKPQYNYGAGVSGSGSGSSGFNQGSSSFGGSSGFLAAPSTNFGSSSSFGSSSGHGGSGFTGGSIGGFGSGFQSGSSGFQSHSSGFQQGGGAVSGGFEAPLVHKQFYTISAPEDHDALERTKHLVIGRPQKNYRVVFIKAPSSSNANVKLSAEYAPKEEKTAIYVLTKKDSALEVNDIATPAPTVPSKPEVFFIKYKTEDEAQHAQRTIQAEYDKIEGTSENLDGGVGQVQSVVGSLDGGAGGAIGGGVGGGIGSGIGSSIGGSSGSIGGNFGSASTNFGVSGGSIGGAKSPTYLPPGK